MSELSDVKKVLHLLSTLVGFKQSENKWINRFAFFSNLNLALGVVLLFYMGGSSITDMISFTNNIQIILINVLFLTTSFMLYTHIDLMDESLEWCATRYRQIDCCNRNIAAKYFSKTSKLSFVVLKIIVVSLMIMNIFLCTATLLVSFLSTDSKYSLHFPFHIPYLEPHDTVSFLVNLFQQFYGGFQEELYFCLILGQIFVTVVHLLQQCKMIENFITEMDEVVKQVGFNAWLKNVIDLTSDIKRLWSRHCKFWELPLLLTEINAYTTIFIIWISVKINPSGLANALAYSVILVSLFFFVLVNEVMLDKFDDMLEALCNVEWYTKTPKERRELLPVLLFLQRAPCLRSGGMKEITFNWFLQLLKSAYSTGLILLSFIE